MRSKQGRLLPIDEAIADLPAPVKAVRNTSPQAFRGFTQADQVDQLVGASEADPDLGFMARLMALCSLPRTNPGNRHQYKRVNGPYKLVMIAGADNKLPFGNLPRLLLGLGLLRSGAHPIPRTRPGALAGKLHALPGCLQRRRRKCRYQTPQPDAAAL